MGMWHHEDPAGGPLPQAWRDYDPFVPPPRKRSKNSAASYLLGVAIAIVGVIAIASFAACEQYEGFCPQIWSK